MLTMKARYALKALARLANTTAGEPVLIATIAEEEQIPLKFLQLILRELRQHGVLRSRKGRGGGYYLGKPASSITLSSLIRLLDGPVAPVPCLSKTAYQRCENCTDEATCGLRLILRDVYEAQLQVLEKRTLADLARATHDSGKRPSGENERYFI